MHLRSIFFLAGLALAVLSLPAHADNDGEARAKRAGASLIGQAAPAAVLTSIDGQEIDLARFYGHKPVYLKFWATWCVPCREQMPGFNRIQARLGKQVEVIAVNAGFSDDADTVRAYRKQHGLRMPVVIDDGSLARSLNLRVTPTHVVINRDGRIIHVGHLNDQRLDDALRLAVSSTPETAAPPAARTQPSPLRIGQSAAGIAAHLEDGTVADLGAHANGKPTAIVFFATWCESYLKSSRPLVSAACERVRRQVGELARKGDVNWIGVASGIWTTEDELREYRRRTGTPMALALDKDGSLFGRFGIRQMPSVVVIDRAGKFAKVIGPNDALTAEALQ